MVVACLANSSAVGGLLLAQFLRMSTFEGPSMGEMVTIPSAATAAARAEATAAARAEGLHW